VSTGETGSDDLLNSAGLCTDADELYSSAKPRDRLAEPCGLVPTAVRGGKVLLTFGNVSNERENGEEFLGRNHRPEQTQVFERLKLGLSHVVTCQERAMFRESLPRQWWSRPGVRFCPGQENAHLRMGEK